MAGDRRVGERGYVKGREKGGRAKSRREGVRREKGQRTSERGRVKGWRMGVGLRATEWGVGLRAGKVVTVKDAIKG